MHVEERAELGRRVGGDMRLCSACELVAAPCCMRGVEARDLRLDRLAADRVVRDLEPRGGDEVRVADRDAAGHADAVQDEVHRPTLAEPVGDRASR